jgi:thiol-disulfide isomerase/thioredoxin
MKTNEQMKKIILFTAIILLTLVSCKKKENYTVLSGQLPYAPNSTIQLLQIDHYFPGFESQAELARTQTDSAGNFVFRTSQLKSGFYQIIRNKYHVLKYDIYLEAGDSINIQQFSGQDATRLMISGKGSAKLNYLLEDIQYFPKDKDFYEIIRGSSFENELDFKAFVDSIHDIRMSTLAENKSVPEKLRSHFEKLINAESASLLLEHLEYRNSNMDQGYDYYYPDSSYLLSIDNLDLNDEFCMNSKTMYLARYYLEYKARNAFIDKSESDWWEEGLSWKLNYISGQPKSLWNDYLALSTIVEFSFGLMLDNFFDNLKAFDKKMEQTFFDEENRLLYQNSAADYYALSPGMAAPDFSLPDSSGNLVRLSDFKGKVVYIDFWGTWCPPCIEEIPDALELQKKYANKPVVFLYVALEYDEENIAEWKNFIAGKHKRSVNFLDNKSFPGIHLVAEKQFGNEEIKPYKINFAPTHVLVDQSGNIISARAKRSGGIANQIDELLE